MFSNFFKSTVRSLLKKKSFSLLNIAGLTIGITCAALIFLWVEDELTFNHYFKNRDNLYQVMTNQTYDAETFTFASTPGLLGPTLQKEMPGIKQTARTTWPQRNPLTKGEKSLTADGMMVDSSFFSMLGFEFINGNAAKPFEQLYSIVLNERMAMKMFNSTNVIGQTVKMNNDQEYVVSAVFKHIPSNTRFENFDWFTNFDIFFKRNEWLLHWGNNGIQTFVTLNPGTDVKALNKKLDGYIKTKEEGIIARPVLLSANDWRLRSNFSNGVQTGGKIKQVNLFSTIAWIIMLLACINFMNLATARSEQRAREVGVRKVLGSGKRMLIGQFMMESLVMSFIAVIAAVILTVLLLPSFNQLVEKQMELNFFSPTHIGALIAIGLICGLIAGSYPAFYLSSFNPITVLKGFKVSQGTGAVYIRKGLVVAQFVISIALIISTLIIYQQIVHTKNRELGMNKDNLIYFDQGLITTARDGSAGTRFSTVQNDLMSTGVVESVSINSNTAFQVGSNSSNYNWKGKESGSEILIGMDWVSPDYINTMGMKLLSGRNFHADGLADSNGVIINESLAKLITKNPAEAAGQIIDRDNARFTVIGVIRDFVYNNIYGSVAPMIMYSDPAGANTNSVNIRFKKGVNYEMALEKVKKVVAGYNPGSPFEFKFVDDEFDKLFKTESLIGKLAFLFAGLAIFISCLGLFGLAAYTAEKRNKEIGIRKILGASVPKLAAMLSADFLKLVALSCLIAFPLSWWLMNNWLKEYEYRVSIQWWMFGVPALLAMIIAIITISTQAIKAAIANPVTVLRSE